MKKALYFIVAIASAFTSAYLYREYAKPYLFGMMNQTQEVTSDFREDKRPEPDFLLFDYANLLEGDKEGVNAYLERIRTQDSIEMVIVTVPSMNHEKSKSIEERAFKLFNNWSIGRDYNNQGVLILVDQQAQDVKIEVSQNLEDVFTDRFSGFAANNQLKQHLKQDTLGYGLVGIMERLEERAHLKKAGGYTPASIAELDRKFISMGGGVKRNLADYKNNNNKSEQSPNIEQAAIRGAKTPDEAWKIIVSKWNREGKYKDIDIYTEACKLLIGDQNSTQFDWASNYVNKPYKIIVQGNYAVVSFGAKEGWDNSPMLLIRTAQPDGWKMDFTNQRKYVIMGVAPYWSVGLGNHPYVYLTSYARQSNGKDIPMIFDDIYTAERDSYYANQYRFYRNQYQQNNHNFEAALQTGRLGAIMALEPKDIRPYLKSAAQLNSNNPEPHRYLAINAVESTHQYKTAYSEMQTFIEKGGDPVFGYNYIGWLLMQLNNHDLAIDAFNKSLKANESQLKNTSDSKRKSELSDQAVYAYEKLFKCFMIKKRNQSALEMYQKMQKINPTHWRTAIIKKWVDIIGKAE